MALTCQIFGLSLIHANKLNKLNAQSVLFHQSHYSMSCRDCSGYSDIGLTRNNTTTQQWYPYVALCKKISHIRDWWSTPTYCRLQSHVTQKLRQK